MGVTFYSGLDTVPGDDLGTTIFNKTAINSDILQKRLGHHGAAIQTRRHSQARTFDQAKRFAIPFENGIYDTDGFWSPTANPQRLTVVEGFTYVEFWLYMNWQVGNWTIEIHKNGIIETGTSYPKPAASFMTGINTVSNQYGKAFLKSNLMKVVPGDYFECALYVNGTGNGTFDQVVQNEVSGTLILVADVEEQANAYVYMRAYT